MAHNRLSRTYNVGESQQVVAIYNLYDDVHRFPPNSMTERSRVGHVMYAKNGTRRSFDVFYINDSVDRTKLPPSDGVIPLGTGQRLNINQTLQDHSVHFEIATQYQAISEPVVRASLVDIIRFASGDISRNCGETGINFVDEITPLTKIRRRDVSDYLTRGKKDAVPRCILETNLDYSLGCVAGWIGGTMVGNELVQGSYHFAQGDCAYCYAFLTHEPFLKTLLKLDKDQLIAELNEFARTGNRDARVPPKRVLRLGKLTEAGSDFTLDMLTTTLEACIETGFRAVMPTKYLRFNPEIAELLRRSGSSLLYSFGLGAVEFGPEMSGHNRDFRLEQSVMYRDAGINVSLYPIIDASHALYNNSISDADKHFKNRNFNALRGIHPLSAENLIILEFAWRNGIPVQLLPAHIPFRQNCIPMLGATWDELNSDANQIILDRVFHGVSGGYHNEAGRGLVSHNMHHHWLELHSQNDLDVRACHHDEITGQAYCGTCFIFPRGNNLPARFIKPSKTRRTRKRRRRLVDHSQESLIKPRDHPIS